jgi:hypothetical protein
MTFQVPCSKTYRVLAIQPFSVNVRTKSLKSAKINTKDSE